MAFAVAQTIERKCFPGPSQPRRKDTDAFGNPLASTQTGEWASGLGGNRGLTTKELDPAAGMYYFYQRWYDPQTATFASRAPFPVFVEHPYAVAHGNPLRSSDATGRLATWPNTRVKVCCRPIADAGGRVVNGEPVGPWHCYIRSASDSEKTVGLYYDGDFDEWATLLFRPQPGQPRVTFDDKSDRNPRDARCGPPVGPDSDPCDPDTSLVDCIVSTAKREQNSPPPYTVTGPNSNTFVRRVLEDCGITVTPDIWPLDYGLTPGVNH